MCCLVLSCQRGYDVSCGAKLTEGTLGFVFKVVSSRFSVPDNVDAVFAFVSNICSDVLVDSEPTRHYSSCKVALEHRYLAPFTSHAEHADHDFSQIEHRTFAFDGPQRKAELLRNNSSSLFDIDAFKQFATHFFLTAPRVLIVQSTRDADLDSFTSIYDRAQWRRDCRICPVIPYSYGTTEKEGYNNFTTKSWSQHQHPSIHTYIP